MMPTNRQTAQLLTSDLVENILRYADNPGECTTYLTSQIRELIGVRSVGVVSNIADSENRIVAICPPRKVSYWNQPEVRHFIDAVIHIDTPQIIEPTSPAGSILLPLDIKLSFIVPLAVGTEQIGMIILLDMLDLKGASIILDSLTTIAPILALILRNAFLYKNLELAVEIKTAQLKKNEELFRSLFEQSQDGIVFFDQQGSILSVNKAFANHLDYTPEEIVSLGLEKITTDNAACMNERLRRVRSGESLTFESTNRHRNGTHIPFDVMVSPITIGEEILFLASFRDISARKKAEEEHTRFEQQLQINARLESLGVLAGGIAHDFNNLMGGMFGYIDLAHEATSEKNVAQYLSKAMGTIDRARALTLQLLTFAKGGDPVKKVGTLFPFVEETARFALSGSSVACTFNVAPDLWSSNFDKHQIGQVIDNLIINAQQAMPAGGTIELAACNTVYGAKEHPLLPQGKYVRIAIKDSGIGIPPDLLSRIFEPFFTTKSKGHGLGLASCFSILKRHDGCIEVTSVQGKGSVFTIFLPAAVKDATAIEVCEVSSHRGNGTVIVMDDEEVILDAIGTILYSFGYTVVGKDNGQDAVDFFALSFRNGQPIAAIILDLTVPGGMGGKEAAAEIRKLDKNVPIFVASGYSEDHIMRSPGEYGFTASLSKPFTRNELSAILNRYCRAV